LLGDEVKARKISVKIAGFPAEIQNAHILNLSKELYGIVNEVMFGRLHFRC